MTEQQIRAIIRRELDHELLKPGGVCDHAREAAVNAVKDIVELKFRNLQQHLIDMGVYGGDDATTH